MPRRPAADSFDAVPAEHGPSTSKILELLKKGPLTSAEVIEKSGLPAPSAYTILSSLRKAGAIETREFEDGKKNVLAAKG